MFLTIFSGCCGPAVPSAPIIEKELPPSVFVADCTVPNYYGTKNRDVFRYIGEYEEAMKNCNEDKKKLRAWMQEQSATK